MTSQNAKFSFLFKLCHVILMEYKDLMTSHSGPRFENLTKHFIFSWI